MHPPMTGIRGGCTVVNSRGECNRAGGAAVLWAGRGNLPKRVTAGQVRAPDRPFSKNSLLP